MTVHVLAVAVAAVASFVLSSAWYLGFGRVLARLNPAYADTGRLPPWQVLLELLRAAVVVTVVATATAHDRTARAGGSRTMIRRTPQCRQNSLPSGSRMT
jgi:hypothetical protein